MTREPADRMSAAAATRPKARTPWSPAQGRTMPSTTPSGFPLKTPGSAGPRTPGNANKTLSPALRASAHASSPNYFEYISDPNENPPNSNAGIYAKKNWATPSSRDGPKTTESFNFQPLETQKRYENFRRESGSHSFSLNHGSLSGIDSNSEERDQDANIRNAAPLQRRNTGPWLSPKSLHAVETPIAEPDEMQLDPPDNLNEIPARPLNSSGVLKDDSRDSVASDSNVDLENLQRNQLSHIDERHPRNSLPHNRPEPISRSIQRSDTLPSALTTDGPTFIPPKVFDDIMRTHSPSNILLLDLRVSHQYAKSRIRGAINLCIPTTLLKRASYNIQRLSASFAKESDRTKFDQWWDTKIIAVYDTSAYQMSDAASCVNILKKFTQESWKGATFIIRGGFNAFSKSCPEEVDHRSANELHGPATQGLSLEPPAAAPVAGGCEMPVNEKPTMPFFGTIRQNMDLIGGVGQMPITIPSKLAAKSTRILPSWLRHASDTENKGKKVADHFLKIEKEEERRMKKALSTDVSYGTPNPLSPNNVQVAGIEKGLKNRYKDILPYDHSRVRLQDVPTGGCDYVNASHVQAKGSRKRYIASQAPVPATFQDFWRVAWEQDARVIVMLTAESEGGNPKCHPYWLPATYGPFKLKSLSERKMSLERANKPSMNNRSFTAPLNASLKEPSRPSVSRRHSSKHSLSGIDAKSSPSPLPSVDPDTPHVIVRKLALSNTNKPFEPLREITQLQYSSWPDFGAPADPAHVLSLVERCNEVVRSYDRSSEISKEDELSTEQLRPVVVHCSAGCGRTGTFCTIDSVIDMLKQQRSHRRHRGFSSHINSPPILPAQPLHGHTYNQEDAGVHDPMDIDPFFSPPSALETTSALHHTSSAPTQTAMDEMEKTDDWLDRDDIDLVGRTVASFRVQRLSMVQTLRQFVLCYESVLEWIASETDRENEK